MTMSKDDFGKWLKGYRKSIEETVGELTRDQARAVELVACSLEPLVNLRTLHPLEAQVYNSLLGKLAEALFEAIRYEDFPKFDEGLVIMKDMIADITEEPKDDREV